MNNKKIIQVLITLTIFIMVVIGYIYLDEIKTYLNSLEDISEYYEVMGNNEMANLYNFSINVISYSYIPVATLLVLTVLVNRKINNDRFLDNYPKVKQDSHGFYYFYLTAIMLLFNFYFVVIYFNINYTLFIILFILLFAIYNVSTISVGNKLYNQVSKKIELIKAKKLEVNDNKKIFKQYKIVRIFQIVLIITLLTFSFTTYIVIKNREYFTFPDKLEINEKTLAHSKIAKVPHRKFTLSFEFGSVFENYRINRNSNIEIIIDSEESIELIDSYDYEIFIYQSRSDVILTEEDYILIKSEEGYKYIINIEDLPPTDYFVMLYIGLQFSYLDKPYDINDEVNISKFKFELVKMEKKND